MWEPLPKKGDCLCSEWFTSTASTTEIALIILEISWFIFLLGSIQPLINGSKRFFPHIILRTIKSYLDYMNGDHLRILNMCCLGRKIHNLKGEMWNIAFKLLTIFYRDTISILLGFWIWLFNAWGYIQLL